MESSSELLGGSKKLSGKEVMVAAILNLKRKGKKTKPRKMLNNKKKPPRKPPNKRLGKNKKQRLLRDSMQN